MNISDALQKDTQIDSTTYTDAQRRRKKFEESQFFLIMLPSQFE